MSKMYYSFTLSIIPEKIAVTVCCKAVIYFYAHFLKKPMKFFMALT